VNWLDIAILIVALLFGLAGLWKGIIRALFGIAGLIGGIALAGHCYRPLAEVLSPGGAIWSGIAAYAIILITTLVAALAIGWFVAGLARLVMLGWLDRLGGFILGAALGSMICAALLAIVIKYIPTAERVISDSLLAGLLMREIPLLLALLPGEFDFIQSLFS
jgi:membrane protein required for colicin V production